MAYAITMGKSVGNIRLGMSREEVQSLLSDLKEWVEKPYGYDREVLSDFNDDFMISYDENNNVDFILCTNPQSVSLNDYLISEYSVWELYAVIRDLTDDTEVDETGFLSNSLGFGMTVSGETAEDGSPYDVIDSVQVAVKDFWKNEPHS